MDSFKHWAYSPNKKIVKKQMQTEMCGNPLVFFTKELKMTVTIFVSMSVERFHFIIFKKDDVFVEILY